VAGFLLKNTNQPRKKLVTKLNNFIIDYTSYSTYNAPKMMVSRFPHASRLSHLPSILPSVVATCFWLVVALQISIGGCIRPRRFFVFIFVQRSVHHPKQWYGVTPTRSVQVVCPPKYLPHRDCGHSVGCCIECSNGGHLRPRPRPSLCLSRLGLRFEGGKYPTSVHVASMIDNVVLMIEYSWTLQKN